VGEWSRRFAWPYSAHREPDEADAQEEIELDIDFAHGSRQMIDSLDREVAEYWNPKSRPVRPRGFRGVPSQVQIQGDGRRDGC
jgi:hypothetical protein